MDASDKVAQQFGVMAFPTNVIIDRKGVVRVVESGFNEASLKQTIEGLLN